MHTKGTIPNFILHTKGTKMIFFKKQKKTLIAIVHKNPNPRGFFDLTSGNVLKKKRAMSQSQSHHANFANHAFIISKQTYYNQFLISIHLLNFF